MSPEAPQTFQKGIRVQIIECGEVIDEGLITRDLRSEIEIESIQLHPGSRTTFAYFPSEYGWKMLFEGMDGERCFSQRAPTYQIKPV